jgi:hypothetical protein
LQSSQPLLDKFLAVHYQESTSILVAFGNKKSGIEARNVAALIHKFLACSIAICGSSGHWKPLIHACAAVLYTHIQQLCTGLFCVPVGVVGKTAANSTVIHHFSKTAETHS